MISQSTSARIALILAIILISVVSQSVNAQTVTGTAILRDIGTDPGFGAPITYYLALPKGSCNTIITGTFGRDVHRTELKVNVANADTSGTPQNIQTCYDASPPSSTYITYFSCPASVNVTDALPFLYITFLTDKTPFYSGEPLEDVSFRYAISHLDVSYSCQ